jgi:hypothetical protein
MIKNYWQESSGDYQASPWTLMKNGFDYGNSPQSKPNWSQPAQPPQYYGTESDHIWGAPRGGAFRNTDPIQRKFPSLMDAVGGEGDGTSFLSKFGGYSQSTTPPGWATINPPSNSGGGSVPKFGESPILGDAPGSGGSSAGGVQGDQAYNDDYRYPYGQVWL